MEDCVWLTRRVSRFEITWAIFGSLAVHVLLFLLLTSDSMYYPQTGTTARFDILWLSPSSTPTAETATPDLLSSQPLAATPWDLGPVTDNLPQKAAEPDTAIAQEPTVPAEDAANPAEPSPAELSAAEPPIDLLTAKLASNKPSPHLKEPPPKPHKPAALVPDAQKKREEHDATEAVEPSVEEEQERVAAVEEKRLEQELQERKRAEQERKAAELAQQEKLAREREAAERAERKREAAAEKKRRAEQALQERKQAEQEQKAAELAQQEELAREREQLAAEKAERKRQTLAEKRRKAEQALQERKQAKQERKTAELAQQEELAREREQLAAERAEQEREAAAEKKIKAEALQERKKAEQERKAAEAAQQEKLAREREQLATDKAEREREAAAEKKRKAEQALQDRKRAEQDRTAAERTQQKKLAREREQLAAERAERDRLAAAEKKRTAELALQERKRAEEERKAAELAQQEKRARERDRLAAERAERDRLAAAEKKRKAEQALQERKRAEEERTAAERAQQEKLARERERLAAEKAEQVRAAATAAALDRATAATRPEPLPKPLLAAAAPSAQAGSVGYQLQAQTKLVQTAKDTVGPKPAEKQPEEKGIVIPSIHGDLKLIVAGAGDVKLTVLFREFRKFRRSRALTRSEARREQKISPIVVKTPEHTKEAIVEKTGEGIYTFTAEPEGGEAARATFTVKIYELSKMGKTKQLGTKSFSGKAVVTRILMPDGIIWEDEAAFSGSMQDSDGITKFNSETGLVWKEYER